VIASVVEASVSFDRLLKFFLKEEQDERMITYESPKIYTFGENVERVKVENGIFSWAKQDGTRLGPITMTVSDGELLAVVGAVGSFKSTLISALLGDPYKLDGEIIIRGSIAYVPQTPWIMNSTVRENILFGLPFDQKVYTQTIYACGLAQDFLSLIAGDLTEIGERGINLRYL
jgi:ABC-type multidrug transport system fused ATPase/permease subunit